MLMIHQRFENSDVEAVFAAYPEVLRPGLLQLRQLIFATAQVTDGAGDLVETLKWGQPAYLTKTPKTGSTIRVGLAKGEPSSYAMFFHCRTTLVDTFREFYSEQFRFQGNRAILFSAGEPLAVKALEHCVALALTYHVKAG